MEDLRQMVEALQGEDVAARASAAESLCHAGPAAAPAVVALVSACGDEEQVSCWAVAALEELGPPPLETRDALGGQAGDSNALVAYWAVTMLGRLGTDAQDQQSHLAGALTASSDGSVRERAAWALGKVGADSDVAVTALKEAATSDSARLARLSQQALEQIQAV